MELKKLYAVVLTGEDYNKPEVCRLFAGPVDARNGCITFLKNRAAKLAKKGHEVKWFSDVSDYNNDWSAEFSVIEDELTVVYSGDDPEDDPYLHLEIVEVPTPANCKVELLGQ